MTVMIFFFGFMVVVIKILLLVLILPASFIFYFLGSINALGVLGQLPRRVVSSRIWHASLCPITSSCFCYFLSQIYTSPCKETLGMFVDPSPLIMYCNIVWFCIYTGTEFYAEALHTLPSFWFEWLRQGTT